MLVRVTNACHMGCNHCMVDALPDGASMTMGVFQDVVDFIKANDFKIAMLSGGEPTEHPEILAMIDLLIHKNIAVALLSNGMFLENKFLTDDLLKRNILVQITNDPRFYPKTVPEIEHPRVGYEHRLRIVSPFGRAVKNKISCTRQSPLCFNLRSLARTHRDFRKAVHHLRLLGKMCTPSVNVDGTLVAGESPFCSSLGTVKDNNMALTNGVCELKCNKCGLMEGLTEPYRKAVGYE